MYADICCKNICVNVYEGIQTNSLLKIENISVFISDNRFMTNITKSLCNEWLEFVKAMHHGLISCINRKISLALYNSEIIFTFDKFLLLNIFDLDLFTFFLAYIFLCSKFHMLSYELLPIIVISQIWFKLHLGL